MEEIPYAWLNDFIEIIIRGAQHLIQPNEAKTFCIRWWSIKKSRRTDPVIGRRVGWFYSIDFILIHQRHFWLAEKFIKLRRIRRVYPLLLDEDTRG